MSKVDVAKQREVIGAFGAMVTTGYSHYEDFVNMAAKWEYSPEIQKVLGESGVISFRAMKSADDIENHKGRLFLVQTVLRQAFYKTHFIPEIATDGNKIILTFLDSRNGKRLERKSYLKALRAAHAKSKIEDIDQGQYDLSVELLSDLSQMLSVKGVDQEGTVYISGLPQDILTASVNSQNWTSCFAPSGEYSVTPYHYARNGNVMIAYFIPDNASKETIHYQGYDIHNKYWRQFLFISSEGNIFPSVEGYPKASRSLTSAILTELARRTKGEVKELQRLYEFEVGYYDDFSNVAVVVKDVEENSLSSDRSLCPYTGDELDEDQALAVTSELDIHYCCSCDETIRGDESIFIWTSEYDGDYVCSHCLSNEHVACNYSGEYFDIESPQSHVFVLKDFDNVERAASHYAENNFKPVALMIYSSPTEYEVVNNQRLFIEGVDEPAAINVNLLEELDILTDFEPVMAIVIDPDLL